MEENTGQKQEEKVEPAETKGVSIFLVDDDKFLLDMYSLKFSKAGLEVDSAFGGDSALKRLRDGYEPDIILLDIIMPGMDGIELLEIIKKEKLVPKSVIIVLTNQADDNDKAKKLGADGFIIKAMTIPSEVVGRVLEIYKNKKK